MHYREAADLPLCARLHANQARAIAKGDADAAARASDKLMDYVETFRVQRCRCGSMTVYEGSAPSTASSSPPTAGSSTSITRSSGSPSTASSGPTRGKSPQQLALAILYEHLGDKDRAVELSEPFDEGHRRQSRQRLDTHRPGDRRASARPRLNISAGGRQDLSARA